MKGYKIKVEESEFDIAEGIEKFQTMSANGSTQLITGESFPDPRDATIYTIDNYLVVKKQYNGQDVHFFLPEGDVDKFDHLLVEITKIIKNRTESEFDQSAMRRDINSLFSEYGVEKLLGGLYERLSGHWLHEYLKPKPAPKKLNVFKRVINAIKDK